MQDYENFEIAEEDFPIDGQEILVQQPKDLVAKALDYQTTSNWHSQMADIAKTDLRLAKSVSKPGLSGFYSYSSRISYADRLEPTNSLIWLKSELSNQQEIQLFAPYIIRELWEHYRSKSN